MALSDFTTPSWMTRMIKSAPAGSRAAALRGANPSMADLLELLAAGRSLAGVTAETAIEAVGHLHDVDVVARLRDSERRLSVRRALEARHSQLTREQPEYVTAATAEERTSAVLALGTSGHLWRGALSYVAAQPDAFDMGQLLEWYRSCDDAGTRAGFAGELLDVVGDAGCAMFLDDIACGRLRLRRHSSFPLLSPLWGDERGPLGEGMCLWLIGCADSYRSEVLGFLRRHGASEEGKNVLLAQAPLDWLFAVGLDADAVLQAALSNNRASRSQWPELLSSCTADQLEVIAPSLIEAFLAQTSSRVRRRSDIWQRQVAARVTDDTLSDDCRLALLRVAHESTVAAAMTGRISTWADAPVPKIVSMLADGRCEATPSEVLGEISALPEGAREREAATLLFEHCGGLLRAPRWMNRWPGQEFCRRLSDGIGDDTVAWALAFQLVPGFSGTPAQLIDTVRAAVAGTAEK